ncbi:MAG TPA: aminoglycoside phosphotransferase family protein [Candidatus Gallacutalibacter stercoravium]|nr:aminoglycoside phosphotransferase family protein [Candidatus Gallacutalibacter stercoravium]
MEREIAISKLEEAAGQFCFQGEIAAAKPFGNGHINDTFLITCKEGEKTQRYILQHLNQEVFQQPELLMENVVNVTQYLRKMVLQQGGDPQREVLNVVPTRSGQWLYCDSVGSYWRSYSFIEGTECLDEVEKPEQFYESAYVCGKFQSMLADYPAATLHETIPDFHNTPVRFETFCKAVQADVCGRAKFAQKEIDFVMRHKEDTHALTDLLQAGQLPLRVTHNDTKLNNIMLDKETGKGLCIVDLDTVMPGLSLYDYGDSIRFGASTAAEDEPDLDKVHLDLTLFETYTKGFLDACGANLTAKELEMLPMGAKVITLECGMRFLTDYLQGDTYFKIHREGHNLDRCRTQFKLVAEMEEKWADMQRIVNRCIPALA